MEMGHLRLSVIGNVHKIAKMFVGVSGYLSERQKLLITHGTPKQSLEEPWLRKAEIQNDLCSNCIVKFFREGDIILQVYFLFLARLFHL